MDMKWQWQGARHTVQMKMKADTLYLRPLSRVGVNQSLKE